MTPRPSASWVAATTGSPAAPELPAAQFPTAAAGWLDSDSDSDAGSDSSSSSEEGEADSSSREYDKGDAYKSYRQEEECMRDEDKGGEELASEGEWEDDPHQSTRYVQYM